MNPRRRAILAALTACALRPPSVLAQGARIDAMRFSAMKPGATLPAELQPWTFAGGPRPTRYSLVDDEGGVVLRADAQGSASGLVREMSVDPRTHPSLAWRWKAMNLVERGDLRRKDGDDFAARVYLTFDPDPSTLSTGERMQLSIARMMHGTKVPAAALCYVWDRKALRETLVPNAFTDRVRMIVAESGSARVGQWVEVRRDILKDYRRAFGTEAPRVTSVIVSTDTDNTGESIVAYYGDISFGPP